MSTLNLTKHSLLYAVIGAALTYGAITLTADDSRQREQITALENRILDLELSLAQKEDALADARFFAAGVFDTASTHEPSDKADKQSGSAIEKPPSDQVQNASTVAAPVPDGQERVKELSTFSDRDPRSFSQKANELLAANADPESVAIVSRSVFELADNREVLPDYELEALYQQQQSPDLKRVLAQVLSSRGDNRLIEKQIQDSQAGLRSERPEERQKALVALAKTRYATAATVIAPLLQDTNNGVKLDALLALRATGNLSHTRMVEALVNDPDPAVSWLAKDVIANLQNLSEKARTQLADADIVAELPVMGTL